MCHVDSHFQSDWDIHPRDGIRSRVFEKLLARLPKLIPIRNADWFKCHCQKFYSSVDWLKRHFHSLHTGWLKTCRYQLGWRVRRRALPREIYLKKFPRTSSSTEEFLVILQLRSLSFLNPRSRNQTAVRLPIMFGFHSMHDLSVSMHRKYCNISTRNWATSSKTTSFRHTRYFENQLRLPYV